MNIRWIANLSQKSKRSRKRENEVRNGRLEIARKQSHRLLSPRSSGPVLASRRTRPSKTSKWSVRLLWFTPRRHERHLFTEHHVLAPRTVARQTVDGKWVGLSVQPHVGPPIHTPHQTHLRATTPSFVLGAYNKPRIRLKACPSGSRRRHPLVSTSRQSRFRNLASEKSFYGQLFGT